MHRNGADPYSQRHGHPASTRRAYGLTLMMLALCLAGAPAAAQKPPAIARNSISYLLPQETGVFVEVLNLRQSDEQFRRAQLWSAMAWVFGPESGAPALDWRALVHRYLGMTPETALADLFGYRVALAAPSWDRLGDAVIVSRLRRGDALDPILGPKRAVPTEQRGEVRVYRTQSGIFVATDGRWAAFTRSGGPDSFFSEVVDLLAKNDAKRLSDSSQFRDLVGNLSNGYVGCAFLSRSGDATRSVSALLPAFGGLAVAMYTHGDRLDFEVRAALDEAVNQPRQSIVDMNRVGMLPSSTLLAWATSVDLLGGYQKLIERARESSSRYLDILHQVLEPEAMERDVLGKLGPRQIVVWDRVRGKAGALQLAVLIESTDAAGVARTLADGLARLDLSNGIITSTTHLETEILTVELPGLRPSSAGSGLVSALLADFRPSFAALDDWLVMATGPEQIQQMVSASEGWIPSLGSMSELKADRWRMAHDAVLLAVARPALTSSVVADLRNQDGSHSLLASKSGSQPRSIGHVHQRLLGIGISRDEGTGAVVVARVQAHQPAVGILHVGDHIIGVDGRLLSLEDPVADLRNRIDECNDAGGLKLRVRRDNRLLDVRVPIPQAIAPAATSRKSAAEALKQLEAVSRTVSYAVYSVVRSREDRFHARISLRLVPSTSPAPVQPTAAP